MKSKNIKKDRSEMRIRNHRIRVCQNMTSYTDQKMADLLGISISTYRKYLQGINPIPSEVMRSITKIIPVNMNYIYYGMEADRIILDEEYLHVNKDTSFLAIKEQIMIYLNSLDKHERIKNIALLIELIAEEMKAINEEK